MECSSRRGSGFDVVIFGIQRVVSRTSGGKGAAGGGVEE